MLTLIINIEVGGNDHIGNCPDAEQIGSLRKGGEICPPCTAMPSLPVTPHLGENQLRVLGETILVLLFVHLLD